MSYTAYLTPDGLEVEEESHNNPEEAIRDLVRRSDMSPSEINSGKCQAFAEAVVTAVCGRELHTRLEAVGCEFDGYEPIGKYGGHVWIYDSKTDRHHDAEMPEGVEHWKNLPFFARKR